MSAKREYSDEMRILAIAAIYVPTEANIPVLEAGKRPIIED